MHPSDYMLYILQEKFVLQCEVQDSAKQLSQQSEYCASMGAACCTLLWRVSRCEDSIQAILAGVSTILCPCIPLQAAIIFLWERGGNSLEAMFYVFINKGPVCESLRICIMEAPRRSCLKNTIEVRI